MLNPATRTPRIAAVPLSARNGVLELIRFTLVGGSGYVVNLAAFAVASGLGAGRALAASLAFVAAVGNNFHWNRRWTFDAADGSARVQARRFLVVSFAAFVVSLGVLDALTAVGAGATEGQAAAIVAVTPLSFAMNRRWSFRTEPRALVAREVRRVA